MAFVSQTDRGIAKFPRNNTKIGPGSYPTQQGLIEKKFNYAPFCSTSMRELIGEKMQLPGPGAYSIKGHIGQPSFTTYSTKKSIIIKVNTTGTNSFLSRQERFSHSQEPCPGPGSYKVQTSHKQRLKTTLPVRKKIVQPIKKGASINTTKALFMNEARAKTTEAMRNLKLEMKKQSNSVKSVWARDRINRFKTKCDNQVGPGKYSLSLSQSKKQPKLSAGFASNTVRSVFDTIIFDTKNKDTLEFRKKKGFKTDGPAPGVYFKQQQKVENEALRYKNGSFGSTIQRFSYNSTSNDTPFYNTNKLGQKVSSKKMPAFGSQQRRCFTIQNDGDLPGPAFYHPEEIKIGQILKIEFGAFGTHVQRKLFQQKKNETVGPGYYDPFRCKTQQIKPSSVFTSVIPRKIAEESPKDQKFGVYDVTQNDISRRALQNRQHRQNLKRIECQKPPFDTQKPRFKHYEASYEQQRDNKLNSKEKELVYLSIKQQQKDKIIENLRKQIPKNISTISKSKRFDDPKKGPGVGDYAIRSKWVQKSYNIKFGATKQ